MYDQQNIQYNERGVPLTSNSNRDNVALAHRQTKTDAAYIGERSQRLRHIAIRALSVRRDHHDRLLSARSELLLDAQDALHDALDVGAQRRGTRWTLREHLTQNRDKSANK